MNIIIPLCGKGERFKNKYKMIKPLINVFDKEIIFYILDNLNLSKIEKQIYIIINKNTNKTNLINLIKSKYQEIIFIDIENETRGPVETVILGINNIKLNYNNLLIIDGDNFYTIDILSKINIKQNSVIYFDDQSSSSQYSYITLNNNIINNIAEKKKISNNANTGLYYFSNINEFIVYSSYIINNNIMFNNEFYISVVIYEMIKKSIIFYGIEIPKNNYISLGTTELVDNYINNTYAFLFDLDGTLIISDHIYNQAWYHILLQYNIFVDENFFKVHIQGNSDHDIITKLLPNLNVSNISKIKDEYLNENIHKIITINGSIDFIKTIKENGHKIAIVTNCNRNVATNIINYLKLNDIIDYLVIGNECKKSKPYPDPYLKAIEYFKIDHKKCFIFEDSNSGLLSAKNVYPRQIIGIDYFDNNSLNLINNGANIIISEYNNNLYDTLINIKNSDNFNDDLKKYIFNSLENIFDIKNIIIYKNNLKGGYISDVIKVDIILNDNQIINTIFKKENKDENNLSLMVEKLKLYNREYFLYENIYNYLNIKVPKYYGIIRDDNFNKLGIILENIDNQNFILNLNLNIQSIEIILIYISNISKMHIKFWNKNLSEKFIGLYKQNSNNLNNIFFCDFIKNNIDIFIDKWSFLLNNNLIEILKLISCKYNKIQNKLSEGALTLCHGDLKSPNIFCKISNNCKLSDFSNHILNSDKNYIEPYFIDWQYICEGKGVQDIIFLMIESFESNIIKKYYNIIIDYYYNKIIESNILYDYSDYLNDITYSISYFPMLVALWFGNINQDELIDKNFPFIFIKKFIFFIENYINKQILYDL